jgi:hypothetical protein
MVTNGRFQTITMESTAMNQSMIDCTNAEERILSYEVPDEQLEAAAAILEGKAINVTVAFCSGLDTCPS